MCWHSTDFYTQLYQTLKWQGQSVYVTAKNNILFILCMPSSGLFPHPVAVCSLCFLRRRKGDIIIFQLMHIIKKVSMLLQHQIEKYSLLCFPLCSQNLICIFLAEWITLMFRYCIASWSAVCSKLLTVVATNNLEVTQSLTVNQEASFNHH